MANFDNKNFLKAALIFWVIVIAAILALLSTRARAVDLEVGFGQTHYIKQTDGVWYQDAFPYWMDTDDQSLSFGLSWKPSETRYRAEFLALGKHFVNALATSDGTYNPYFVTHCGDSCGLVALQGRGSVSGLVLSASRDVPILGLPFYAEAGVYANVKKWQVTVSSLMGDQVYGEAVRKHQIDYGPVIGFGIRYSGVDVGFRYIYLDDSSEGDPITPMMTGAYSLMFKAYF